MVSKMRHVPDITVDFPDVPEKLQIKEETPSDTGSEDEAARAGYSL